MFSNQENLVFDQRAFEYSIDRFEGERVAGTLAIRMEPGDVMSDYLVFDFPTEQGGAINLVKIEKTYTLTLQEGKKGSRKNISYTVKPIAMLGGSNIHATAYNYDGKYWYYHNDSRTERLLGEPKYEGQFTLVMMKKTKNI